MKRARCVLAGLWFGPVSTAVAGRDTPPTPAEPPRFGADISAGYHIGRLTGVWPQAGFSGGLYARYDAFAQPKETAAPRLGMSIWGGTTVRPEQQGLNQGEATPSDASFLQYGVMGVIRPAAEQQVGLNAGLGFSRIDLNDYYDGPLALPTLTFEAGPRLTVTDRAFADLLLRANWATARSGFEPSGLEEWWLVTVGLEVGTHVH